MALTDPLGAAAALVKFALEAGGMDNMTVVLAARSRPGPRYPPLTAPSPRCLPLTAPIPEEKPSPMSQT